MVRSNSEIFFENILVFLLFYYVKHYNGVCISKLNAIHQKHNHDSVLGRDKGACLEMRNRGGTTKKFLSKIGVKKIGLKNHKTHYRALKTVRKKS